jgi:hypothetical protein
MKNNKGLFAQIEDVIVPTKTFTSAKDIEDYIDRISSKRVVTLYTGQLGMHEFDFALKCMSMGVKGSYLKTSNNYGGHTLDKVNKVYFRWKSKKQQFFVSTLNNKILFIGKSMTEALEFHKNSLNGK